MYELSCIKCGTKYSSNDPDPYYCESCNTEKKRIAADLDRKFDTREPAEKPMSDLEAYDASAKIIKTRNGRTISFAPTKL